MQDIAAAIRQGLLVYSILLAALIILTETEWDRFLSLFRALDGWIIRGFLQLFEAGLTLELARATGASDFHRSTQVQPSAICSLAARQVFVPALWHPLSSCSQPEACATSPSCTAVSTPDARAMHYIHCSAASKIGEIEPCKSPYHGSLCQYKLARGRHWDEACRVMTAS